MGQGNATHTITPIGSLFIAPGAYVVLARSADSAANGGFKPDYVYNTVTLADDTDSLTVSNPSGETVDSMAWGGGAAEGRRGG